MSAAWTNEGSPLSAKHHVTEITERDEEEHEPQGGRDDPAAPWIRSLRADSRSTLIEPLAEGGLLGGGPGRPARVRNSSTPHGLTRRPGSRPPCAATPGHDRAGVADEFAGERAPAAAGRNGPLELLHQVSASGSAPARDSSKLVKASTTTRPRSTATGRQHAEHPRGPVAVAEVAALRRGAPDEQERGDRESRMP